MKKTKNWIPEIVYEEGESKIPFIHIPEGEKDPGLLFIFLARQTGEFEPGPEGEDVPVTDMDLRQFVDLSILKSGLTEQEYDKVRSVLGLQPLRDAVEMGRKITDGVREKIEK
jgi:hypothetical protein